MSHIMPQTQATSHAQQPPRATPSATHGAKGDAPTRWHTRKNALEPNSLHFFRLLQKSEGTRGAQKVAGTRKPAGTGLPSPLFAARSRFGTRGARPVGRVPPAKLEIFGANPGKHPKPTRPAAQGPDVWRRPAQKSVPAATSAATLPPPAARRNKMAGNARWRSAKGALPHRAFPAKSYMRKCTHELDRQMRGARMPRGRAPQSGARVPHPKWGARCGNERSDVATRSEANARAEERASAREFRARIGAFAKRTH